MCGFHQGQRLYNASPQGRIYGRNILFATSEFYLASRGEPYMTPTPDIHPILGFFYSLNAPDQRELTELVHTISHRIAGVAAQAGAAMPIYFKTSGIREAPITDALGQYPLPAQNALQR